jgi:hypothetical protein
MYEAMNRCPGCGRDADSYSYGPDRQVETGGGTDFRSLFLYSMTRGPLQFVEGGRIKTVGVFNEAEFRT